MATMYDAVDVTAIPADAAIVAGYVDGHYQTIPALRARFPHATIVEITVTGRPGVHVCDCETGDLTPQQAADWARAEIAAGRRPTIYCNTSTWPSVRSLLGSAAAQVDFWVAQYDGNPTIPAGAVAKQYSTGSYDTTSTAGGWPAGAQPAPAPVPTPATSTEDFMDCKVVTATNPATGKAAEYAIRSSDVLHIPDATTAAFAWANRSNTADTVPPAEEWENLLWWNKGQTPV